MKCASSRAATTRPSCYINLQEKLVGDLERAVRVERHVARVHLSTLVNNHVLDLDDPIGRGTRHLRQFALLDMQLVARVLLKVAQHEVTGVELRHCTAAACSER